MAVEFRILIAWLLFGGTHIVGSSVPVRTALIRRLGLRGFKAVYSLVALATFVLLGFLYFTGKHAGAFVYTPQPALRHVTELLMLAAFFVLAQGLATPSPITTEAELSGRHGGGARGIQRVTRHPVNLGFALFGVAHAVANPTVGDWVFFGGFVVYALVSAWHQDRRILATGAPEAKRFVAETSFLPFAAVLAGRQRLALRELRPVAALLAVGITVALRVFHGRIFGGFG